MVSGHLEVKKGLWYIVLEYRDAENKRKRKWVSTKLSEKGNKKRAEVLLQQARKDFIEPSQINENDILFSDFLLEWLEVVKSTISIPTYASYSSMLGAVVVPYFKEKKITLRELQAKHIQDFYTEQLKRVKAVSVIHYHANIHKALKYAVKMELIPYNPAERVERPKKDRFTGSFYDKEEMTALFEAVKGHKLELGVLLGSFYGLRRSEVIGLKWNAVDFKANTITIQHTVCRVNLDGKSVIVAQDSTKTKSSLRTLPLVPMIKERLQELKKSQKQFQKLCGNSYNMEYLDYVYVDEMGELMRPDYMSAQFPKFLERNGLRRIRFHDLRHSCASLLLANGVPMKQIQEWLGHSDFSTTANVYAHLDYSSKISSANAMLEGLGLE